jgi:formate hydrogenlyase subunit 6/NADH:ubiquinone oxidoreductase subunit I
MAYFRDIAQSIKSLASGLKESFGHLKKGHHSRGAVGIEADHYFKQANDAVTVQYPAEQIPVPDVGRYRLHMEADDCIVCDKCARICPVDCIDIEGIKATEDLGHTSDGSKKRLHLAQFDIDMAKCCYCGLCTTVCPTECLTMTKVYDYSEFDRDRFIYHFGLLSPEEAEQKKAVLAEIKAAQVKEKASAAPKPKSKPKLKPNIRPRDK